MILAGDIGGTKTVLALFHNKGDEFVLHQSETFASQEFETFDEILKLFLTRNNEPEIDFTCLGVAGPVIKGVCTTTNLPWRLSEDALNDVTGSNGSKLLNDLEAAAYGMLYLDNTQKTALNPGVKGSEQSNIAVIAAGTGLGEAILFFDGNQYFPIASEGGHADFAPRTDQEIALLNFLREEFGHVSYERILSGPGLYNVYRFIRHSRIASEPEWLSQELKQRDPAAVIGEMAIANKDLNCVETVKLFLSIYGAEAGNLALKCNAFGGIYIGGGIAPKLLALMQSGLFLQSLIDKGRFQSMLEKMPVVVSTEPLTPLYGAARFGLKQWSKSQQ